MKFIAAMVLVGAFSACSLKWLPVPWVWSMAACAGLLLTQVRFKKPTVRVLVCWNLAMALIILAATETYLSAIDCFKVTDGKQISGDALYDSVKDDNMGYVLKSDSTKRAAKYYGEEKIYDVTYTVDADGLRVAPPCRTDCDGAVLFFGGSFTYGEGVNDEETMPYRVGVRAQGQYHIYNFGVHGYGPQHMLALIESGRVRSVAKETPQHAVYQALYPSHAQRAAGKYSWLQNSPRYTLDGNGTPVRHGSFKDSAWTHPTWKWLRWQIRKSSLGRRLLTMQRWFTAADRRLFLAIVKRSADLLKSEYPSLKFHVLIWNSDKSVMGWLADNGIDVCEVSGLTAEAERREGTAVLHEKDYHPSPLMHDLIAQCVTESMLGCQQKADLEVANRDD